MQCKNKFINEKITSLGIFLFVLLGFTEVTTKKSIDEGKSIKLFIHFCLSSYNFFYWQEILNIVYSLSHKQLMKIHKVTFLILW